MTLDIEARHNPDVVHDLERLPLPFGDDSADEIHAYEVLEHLGRQGDWRFFFAQWTDFWRVLKPGGGFFGSVPHPSSPWAFGDPSHTRVIPPETFHFLRQPTYDELMGKTPLSDFRSVYKADFEIRHLKVNDGLSYFALEAIKPSRCTVP